MTKKLALCGFLLGILFCSVGCSIKSEEQIEPVKSDSVLCEETTAVSDTEATVTTSEKIIKTTSQMPQQSVSSAENSADESDSSLPKEIPEVLSNNNEITLRKEKCTQNLVESFQDGVASNSEFEAEQKIIYDLMDRDVICYFNFRYASSAIEDDEHYYDNFFEIKKHTLFKNYLELKNFVYDTYSDEIAEKLLKEHDADRALYLSKDQLFLYNAENLGIVIFDIFSEGYEIEITNISNDEIEFICYYSVLQDEKMEPVKKDAFCRAKKTKGDLWKLDQSVWLSR